MALLEDVVVDEVDEVDVDELLLLLVEVVDGAVSVTVEVLASCGVSAAAPRDPIAYAITAMAMTTNATDTTSIPVPNFDDS